MTALPGAAAVAGLGGSAAQAEVGPGLVGFLATFAVAVVTVLLMLDMTRRLRRLRYRADQQAASEQRARDEGRAAGGAATGSAHTGRSPEPHGREAGPGHRPEVDDERHR